MSRRAHSRSVPVGISACLLGREVRFDGGHKRDRFLTEALSPWVRWVPVCPEVEIGLGTPRESLRLIGDPSAPRLVAPRSGADHTDAMGSYAADRVAALRRAGIRGFVLKKASPSCGMERVRVYDGHGVPSRDGVGLFARELTERWPELPVEEEGRLNDPALRESFVLRLLTYDRWRTVREGDPGRAELVAFHTAHKLVLMAHDPAAYKALGRFVAELEGPLSAGAMDEYEGRLMAALARPASSRRHVNVLHHLLGFLKGELPGDDRRAILDVIDQYRAGWVPLITPVTLLRHHLRKLAHPWIEAQVYLQPHPAELGLWSR